MNRRFIAAGSVSAPTDAGSTGSNAVPGPSGGANAGTGTPSAIGTAAPTETGAAAAASGDALLRDVLKQAIEHAEAEPGQVTAVNESMANVLYDRGNHQAAKELLCDERRYYEIFRTSAAPCTVRTQWSGDVALSPTAPARPEEARGR